MNTSSRVLLSRTKVNRANWNKFKELAKYMGITTEEFLDKVISVAVQKYKIEVTIADNVKTYYSKSPEPQIEKPKHSETESSHLINQSSDGFADPEVEITKVKIEE